MLESPKTKIGKKQQNKQQTRDGKRKLNSQRAVCVKIVKCPFKSYGTEFLFFVLVKDNCHA